MKRVLSLVLALVLVLGMIPTFAAGETGAELLKQYEFVTGNEEGDLMVDSMLTREQLAALIAELNGVKDEAAEFVLPPDYTDVAKIGAWARPFVAFAQVQTPTPWMSGKPGNMFDPKGQVPANQLAAVLLNALGYEFTWETVLDVAAEVGIDFATEGALTRGEAFEAMWVAVSEVPMNDEAGMTLGVHLGKLENPNKILAMTAAVTGVKKVEVKFNKPVDTTKAVVQVKKGAAIYSGTVTWNELKDTATVATVIALPAGDYTVSVTGLEKDLTATVTVAAEAVGKIEFTTTTLDDASATAKIPFVVKNQYGEDMAKVANTSGLVVSAYNVTQNAAVTVTAGANKYFTVDTATTAAEFKTGDVVRVIVSYAGLSAQTNLTVQQPAVAGTLSFGELKLAKDDVRLNVADGTVNMAYVLLDQYGQPMTLSDAGATNLPATLNGVQFVSSNAAVISKVGVVTVDKVSYLQFTVVGDGTATITAIVNASGTVANTQITVAKNGTPTTAVVSAPTMLVAAGDKAFDLTLSVVDQYGDVVKTNAGLTATLLNAHADLTGGAGTILTVSAKADKLTVNVSGITVTATRTATVEIKNGTTVIGTVQFSVEPNAAVSYIDSVNFGPSFEVLASKTLAATDIKAYDQYGRTISAAGFTVARKVGAETIFSSADGATTFVAGAAAGTQTFTVTLGGKTKDITLSVVASADIKTYTIDTIDPIYKSASNTYNVDVLLLGKTEAGVAVVLASDVPQIVTSSNPAVVLVDGLQIRGNAVGTATVSAWLAGKVVATQEVTVTDAAPVATSIAITATATATVTDLNTLVTVKDQYGVAFIADPGTYLVNGVVKLGTDTLAAGTYDVTFVANNGLTKTVSVVAN